eukprot:scaffold14995_cov92-Cylindrotheca_fusiformis.AAC.2
MEHAVLPSWCELILESFFLPFCLHSADVAPPLRASTVHASQFELLVLCIENGAVTDLFHRSGIAVNYAYPCSNKQ